MCQNREGRRRFFKNRQRRNPEERKTSGEAGEEVIYLTLEAIEIILSEVLKETKDKGLVLERARIMFPSLLDFA